jgi:NADH dehydrogenase
MSRKHLHIVVVGGGFGGVKTALELANKRGINVTLISQGMNFEYHGALYRTATGRSPMEVVIPLRDIFKRAKNVSVVLDTVTKIDPKMKRIESEAGNVYAYDKVVLALGNVTNYFGIEGMEQNTATMTTISNTMVLRHKLIALMRSKKETVHIAVIGAGASGVELVAELPYFAELVAKKDKRKLKKLELTLIEGSDRVLPLLRPEASDIAHRKLESQGIALRLNTRVNACEPGKVCMDTGDINADLIIWTAGSRPADFYTENAKVFEMERGKAVVDHFLRAKGHNDVYVIGDNAKTPYSGMAQTAIHDAKFIARNFLAMTRGAHQTLYRAWHPIYVVTVGPNWAVVQTEKKISSGRTGWRVRRQADLWIFRNFEPYKKAVKTWRKGGHVAKF